MAERDLNPKPAPEKLILAYQARQSFAEALNIAEQLTYPPDQRSLYAHIGKNQALIGLNSVHSLDFLTGYRQTAHASLKKWGGNVGHEKIVSRYDMAEILMAMGEVDIAFDLAAPEGSATHPLQLGFDLRLSRKMFQKGKDPQPALNRALASAGLIGVSDGYKSDIIFEEPVKVWGYAFASEAYYDVERDYRSLLAETLDLANKLKYHRLESFSYLAQAYAHCDDLESAWQMIDRMSEEKDRSDKNLKREQTETLRKIARSRLATGDIGGAGKAALRTEDNLFVAEVSLECACLHPENGKFLLEQALDYRDLPLLKYRKTRGENGPAEYDLVQLAIVDSLIGRTKFILGEDGLLFFDRALKTAGLLEDYNDRIIAFNGIAKNQALSGLDAESTWEFCFRAAEEIFENCDEKKDWLDVAEYSMYMEDVTETQVECDYFDLARATVEKIAAVKETNTDGARSFKGKIISDIALKQGKNGLNNMEITDLPEEEIRAILTGDNELAKEALKYFGLDKKVA